MLHIYDSIIIDTAHGWVHTLARAIPVRPNDSAQPQSKYISLPCNSAHSPPPCLRATSISTRVEAVGRRPPQALPPAWLLLYVLLTFTPAFLLLRRSATAAPRPKVT